LFIVRIEQLAFGKNLWGSDKSSAAGFPRKIGIINLLNLNRLPVLAEMDIRSDFRLKKDEVQ